MEIEIRGFRFAEKRLFREFLALPRKLYANDPHWVPEFAMERTMFHNPAKNPLRQQMDITYFLAYRDKTPVGRITAHHYPAHNRTHHDHAGFFGFFESIDDTTVAKALFDAAAARVKEMGLDTLRGPMDFSTNEEVGSLIWAVRDEPPAVMMRYNPAYYAPLYEACGFTKAKDLLAFEVTDDKWPNEKIQRVAKLARKRGATIREIRIDKKNWPAELEIIAELYQRAWEKNWGFVPLSREEFKHAANDLRAIVYQPLCLIAEVNGAPVGWAMVLPDLHQILRHTKGRLLSTIWHLGLRKTQLRWDIVSRARIATLGIVPEFRKRGIEALFYERIFEVTINSVKISRAEMSWILEDNAEMVNGAKMMQADHYKTYRVYERPISD